jgi:hypothetical protein
MFNLAALALALETPSPGTGWHGVSFGRIGMACGACAVVAVIVGAALQAGAFHSFQKLTPGTWRTEGSRQWVCSTVGRVLGGLAFPFMYVYTGMPQGVTFASDSSLWIEAGLKFGVLAWAAVGLPQTISTAAAVNFHRNFVIGLLLDWLLVCLACGLICTKVLTVIH